MVMEGKNLDMEQQMKRLLERSQEITKAIEQAMKGETPQLENYVRRKR